MGLADFGVEPALEGEELGLGLGDVAAGAGDVALVAVENGERDGETDIPGAGAFDFGGGVVLIGDGVVEEVDVVQAVGAGEVDFGFGAAEAEAGGGQVGSMGPGDLEEVFERGEST